MAYGVLITGTDTGVGKTSIGIMLLELLSRRGVNVRPRKPVESGCIESTDGLVPSDAMAYYKAAGGVEPLSCICRYRLGPALSPDLAAFLQDVVISLQDVIEACNDGVNAGDFLLLEGAGGFCSPLTADALNADLAMAMGLPVLLVTSDRLGAIHQTISTAEAIAHRGLALAGVVLNSVTPSLDPRMKNADFLSRWLGRKVIEVGYSPIQKTSRRDEYPPALAELAIRLSDGANLKAF